MSKKKNLTKNKKIRKQMLAASAAGLVLISSAASMGTSLAYAAEKNQLTTAATATASSLQTASNKPVNPSLMKWNVGEILPSTYSPKNNYSGQIAETVRGATFKLTFSFYRNPGSSLTANDIKIDVKGKNVRYERSQSMDQLNVQVTFQAEGANTDFSIKWPATGKGGMRKWCTTDFGKYTDVPESGIANRGKINNLLNGIYSTSGVFASDVTYTKINMVSELIKSDIPMDDNYQYASAYWFYFLTPFLTRAASDVTRIDDATAAVNRLFDSKQQPKPTNTQAQVTAAKVKVDLLPKCSKKTMLLEKVEIAQQALDPSGSEAAKVQAATEAVNALFNGETPKPENTQEQINAAKAKVEALKDGNTKTALLAKIQKAQQALDASAGEEAAKVQAATEAVNALFNGGTPKPENTQEQINAAKAKVEALKDGDTKTAL
ncbi:toxin Cry1Ac domain D-VI-related protein, partial [Enterococcus ratti]|uniref:toxin Cry1Ac domain D-VI-related protein n=1 Tax=Enterococcus ratti TaxID=150033 RepID=UPI003515DCFB